jgi:hypothetical protein
MPTQIQVSNLGEVLREAGGGAGALSVWLGEKLH